jgi:hypothetical protein
MGQSQGGQIFINCPFDESFSPLLRAIQFTVHACGYTPRSALEEDNSADIRLSKIFRLIKECRYGIHDISCTELDPKSQLPRFNMPFELGLFLGISEASTSKIRRKCALVLDRERYRYQIYLSDIAGQDIRSHGGTPYGAIQAVRKWLNAQDKMHPHPGTLQIQKLFDTFSAQMHLQLQKQGLSVEDLSFVDWSNLMQAWIVESHPPS